MADVPAAAPVPAPAAVPAAAPAAAPVPAGPSKAEQFARAAQKEKEFRAAERAAKQEQAKLAQMQTDYEAKIRSAQEDPIGHLESLGISFPKLVDQITQREPPKPKNEVAELKKQFEDYQRAQVEAAQKAANAQLDQDLRDFRTSTAEEVTKAGEKYELVNAYAAQNFVAELMIEQAKKGKVLSLDEAAEMVEKELDLQTDRVVATKKAKAKLAPKPEAPKPAAPVKPQDAGSLAGATATTGAVEEAKKELTKAERHALAIKVLENRGKMPEGA